MSSYFKGTLIGMFIVIGSLILMGYTSSDSEVGRYQIIYGRVNPVMSDGTFGITEENIYKIDTKTGDVYEYFKYINESGSWGRVFMKVKNDKFLLSY